MPALDISVSLNLNAEEARVIVGALTEYRNQYADSRAAQTADALRNELRAQLPTEWFPPVLGYMFG